MNPDLEKARDVAAFAFHFVAALARKLVRAFGRGVRRGIERMKRPAASAASSNAATPGAAAVARRPAKRRTSLGRRLAAWGAAVVVVYTVAAWAGVAIGRSIFEVGGDVKPVPRDFDQQGWKQSTKVFAADGEEIYSFAEERRDLVEFKDISPYIIEALIAVEDAQFREHDGINPRGITRAVVADLQASAKAGRLVFPQGGSSLTQQLAKLLFTDKRRTKERKIQEAGYALRIEREYSKDQILTAYLNLVYFGHQRYGVESASQFYFGKSAKDVTIAEAAMLAGLPQAPNRLSPRANPEMALERRNHVLDRMLEMGKISADEARAAKAEAIALAPTETRKRLDTQQAAPFFVEDVRRQLTESPQVGGTLNTGGLSVQTTIDMDLQRKATRAVRAGLRSLDKQIGGFRPIERNVLADGIQPEEFQHPLWLLAQQSDDVVPGIVLSSDGDGAVVRVGDQQVAVDRKAIAWTKRTDVSEVLRRGDVAPFLVEQRSGDGRTIERLKLEQDPQLEAALVAIDVDSGEVLAMVGGYDYNRSEFNCASQALRQVGSAFKPIYYATALERGLRPSTTMIDEPTVFIQPWNGEQYSPENYYPTFYGRVTIREALEKSLNVASVRLLNYVGYKQAIETARHLGITGKLEPYPSLALGAPEVTLLELTSAYGAFPNGGLHVNPTMIRRVEDPGGIVRFEGRSEAEQAMTPQTAFQMTQMMRGVVQRGTAEAAKVLGKTIAGKTGTTNDWSDAWFVGFNPSIVVGVWVGYPQEQRSIGKHFAGAKAALPIWIDFMRGYFEGRPDEQFADPGGIDWVPIDRETGLIFSDGCALEDQVLEAFAEDNKPVRACSGAVHRQISLPRCLKRFSMDDNGVIVVPDEELLFRMADDPSGECPMRVDAVQRVIEHGWEQGGIPRAWSYRVGYAPEVTMLEDSVEALMMADRQTTRRGDLSDFDVTDGGKTVIVVRND